MKHEGGDFTEIKVMDLQLQWAEDADAPPPKKKDFLSHYMEKKKNFEHSISQVLRCCGVLLLYTVCVYLD